MSNVLESQIAMLVRGQAIGRAMPAVPLSESSQSSDSISASKPNTSRQDARRADLELPPDFPRVINDTWCIISKLGSGSFGEVFEAASLEGTSHFAVKIETGNQNLLKYEAKIYRVLNHCHRSIPRIEWFGQIKGYPCLVMERLGSSLESIKNKNRNKRLEPRDVLLVGMQAIETLMALHKNHIIHRDIKADNFVVGWGERAKIVYLIDYGLAKQYREPKSLLHIPYREHKTLTGTPRFASINNHHGCECSRRDDLEALAYVLIYLVKGSLPWQNIQVPKSVKDQRRFKNRKILEMKMGIPLDVLCQGVPEPICNLLVEARRLEFSAKPDYRRLMESFASCLQDSTGHIEWDVSWAYSRHY